MAVWLVWDLEGSLPVGMQLRAICASEEIAEAFIEDRISKGYTRASFKVAKWYVMGGM